MSRLRSAIVLCQAYQLARAMLAFSASPVLRLMFERDHLVTEVELLRRELAVLRDQRAGLPPQKRLYMVGVLVVGAIR